MFFEVVDYVKVNVVVFFSLLLLDVFIWGYFK